MTGFLGQKFDFSGTDDAWYALISDFNGNDVSGINDVPGIQVNMVSGVSTDLYGTRGVHVHMNCVLGRS